MHVGFSSSGHSFFACQFHPHSLTILMGRGGWGGAGEGEEVGDLAEALEEGDVLALEAAGEAATLAAGEHLGQLVAAITHQSRSLS